MRRIPLLLASMLFPLLLIAQSSVFVGASFDPLDSPKTSGAVGILKPILGDQQTFMYSLFTVHGASVQTAIITPQTGIAHTIPYLNDLLPPRINCLADATGGAAITSQAASGLFSGGGFCSIQIKGRFSLMVGGHAIQEPVTGGFKGAVMAAIQISPSQALVALKKAKRGVAHATR